MSRLCPPELFVACHAVRAAVPLGGTKVFVGRDVAQGELVLVSVLQHPLLGFGLRGFLSLDFLAGVVDFTHVSAIYGYQIDSVGLVVSHDCGVLFCGFEKSPGRRDGESVIEGWIALSVSVSCTIAKSDATRLDLCCNETACLHKLPWPL